MGMLHLLVDAVLVVLWRTLNRVIVFALDSSVPACRAELSSHRRPAKGDDTRPRRHTRIPTIATRVAVAMRTSSRSRLQWRNLGVWRSQ